MGFEAMKSHIKGRCKLKSRHMRNMEVLITQVKINYAVVKLQELLTQKNIAPKQVNVI